MLDLTVTRHVHVVGAGGSGMAPLATILLAMGHRVTGSDQVDSPRLARLRALGAEMYVGHAAAQIVGADVVVASTAIDPTNPELEAAGATGAPIWRRADVLAAVCAQRQTLAVGGTHGKTTTTAMLATVLEAAGSAPSYLVGGDVPSLNGGGHWGSGAWFVVEADESDGTFLELGAEAVVLTSVEADHLDHHGDLPGLRRAFVRFLAEASGPKVVCIDDPGAADVAAGLDCLTYGTTAEARYRLRDLDLGRDGATFTLADGSTDLGRISVPMPGVHNARNAAAAAVAAMAVGADFGAIAAGLGGFGGVGRRYERRGETAGVTFIDSYDHLPGEVAAVLEAAGHGGWKRVVCVFQPHRYTRTAALWRDFAGAFDGADVLAVTDVYAAGQAPMPGVSGKLIVDAVLDAHPGRRVAWLPTRRDVLAWLAAELRPGDLCLTLGAGDLTTLPDEVVAALAVRS